MSTHTPGPWFTRHNAKSATVGTASGCIVAKTTDADARLIAAAPDLLAVAKRIALWPARKRPAMLALQEAARAAIAKAEAADLKVGAQRGADPRLPSQVLARAKAYRAGKR
jgi:type VI protein secretion system component VasF